MDIIDLRSAPEHLPTLARWHHEEWGYLNPGETLADRIDKMRAYLGEATIPTLLIAVENDKVLGSAALIAADMDNKPELSPWLANVFVRNDQRGRGLGSALVKAIMALAASSQWPHLYLFTPDQEVFYSKLGWKPLSKEVYRDTPITIMQLDCLIEVQHPINSLLIG